MPINNIHNAYAFMGKQLSNSVIRRLYREVRHIKKLFHVNDTTVQFKEGSMVVVTCRRYLSSLKGKLYLGIEENPKFKM